MKSKKIAWFNLLSALLIAFLLAQCTPAAPAAPSQSSQEQQPAAQEPAGSGEKIKIVYWSMFSEGEPLQILLAEATNEFMAENPDIEVEIKWAGRQVLTQLQSAVAAKTQVDIVDHSDDRVLNAIVKNGLALPMDEYLNTKAYDSDENWGDTFVTGALDLGKYEGKTYLIPRDDYVSAFFYNAGMLEEMGLSPQAKDMKWEDFTALLDGIKAKNPEVSPLGADGNVPFYNNWWFTYLAIRLAGQDAFREAAYDETGEAWKAPEFLQAAQMLRELQDKGYFQKGFEGSVWPAAQVQWVNGEVGMQLMGAWLPKEMSEQTPEGFKIDLFAFPDLEGGKGNQVVEHWANTYGVLNTTKNPEAVAAYLKYIMSKKVGTRIAEAGTPVPLEGVPVPPALANQYEILKTYSAMPARAGLNTEIPEYMDNVFNVCDDKFFQMQIGPEEFIDCLATESSSYWAKK